MNEQKFYSFLQKQILLLLSWSLVTGLGYTVLCYVYGVAKLTIIWYGFIVAISFWGWKLYRQFIYCKGCQHQLKRWYKKIKYFIYLVFCLWTALFVMNSNITVENLHNVTVFIQVMATVLASTFLLSDRKLFMPIFLILIFPLVVYFSKLNGLEGYILSSFSIAFVALIVYSSHISHELMQNIFYHAQRDALTGLYNRRYFLNYLEQLLQTLKITNKFAYILLIDLDHFKTINDSLGHDVGDSLLCEVSNRIKKYCGDTHLITRLGGDEFTITSFTFSSMDECTKHVDIFSKELGSILRETYVIEHNHLHISASIGVKIMDATTTETIQVIKEADIAMYEVKSGGRDGVVNYNNVLAAKIDNTLEMERNLYFALKNNEIELHYQAQVNAREEIVGCEVLARWYNPDLGIIEPLEFIKIAERTGIIVELGNFILEESFKTLKKWEEETLKLEQFSINISVGQLLDESFAGIVEKLCKQYLNDNMQKKLVFEITETLLAEDINTIVSIIKTIKKLGIRFSLDDFGTGYSSLNYLREIPIDELKIDHAFIGRLGENSTDEKMLHTIFSLANIFKLRIVAEGVETGDQFRFLLAHNCHIFQGFYFSRPMKRKDFEIDFFNHKVKKVNMEFSIKKEFQSKRIG